MTRQPDNHDWGVPIPNETENWGEVLNVLLEEDLDREVILYDPEHLRPPAGNTAPYLFFATDEQRLDFNDGVQWHEDIAGPGDTLGLADGEAAAPAFSFADDPDTGWYRAGDDTIGLAAGGTTVAVIDEDAHTVHTPVHVQDDDWLYFGDDRDWGVRYDATVGTFSITANPDGTPQSVIVVRDDNGRHAFNGSVRFYDRYANDTTLVDVQAGGVGMDAYHRWRDNDGTVKGRFGYDGDGNVVEFNALDGGNEQVFEIDPATGEIDFANGLTSGGTEVETAITVENDATAVFTGLDVLNFGTDLDVTDDGNGGVTVEANVDTGPDGAGTDHTYVTTEDESSDLPNASQHANLSGADVHDPAEHDNADHSEAFIADGDGTSRDYYVIDAGAGDPSGAGPDDLIFEREP